MLVSETEKALTSLVDPSSLRDALNKSVEGLIAVGDLVERMVSDELHVFTSMPRYVPIADNLAVILGCRPDGVPLLDNSVRASIVNRGALRFCEIPVHVGGSEVRSELLAHGLVELSWTKWLNTPRAESAEKYVEQMSSRAKAGKRAGVLDAVSVFNPRASHKHYRSRFEPLDSSHGGISLVRYARDFGPDAWAVCEIMNGTLGGIVRLPTSSSLRGCDQAWRLMAAIDHLNEKPLPVKVRRLPDTSTVDLFAPPPSWIEKYLALFGQRVSRTPGSLFSYVLPIGATAKFEELVKTTLWATTSLKEDLLGE
jgi:hypothetical protein